MLGPSYNLTSDDLWPQYMTFNCINIQKVQYCIHEPSLVPIRLQLFKWGQNFTFLSAYLKLWPQMTIDLDMWLSTMPTNRGPHAAFMIQLCLKSYKACGSLGQMSTVYTTNWKHWTKRFLGYILANAGNTKMSISPEWLARLRLMFCKC